MQFVRNALRDFAKIEIEQFTEAVNVKSSEIWPHVLCLDSHTPG